MGGWKMGFWRVQPLRFHAHPQGTASLASPNASSSRQNPDNESRLPTATRTGRRQDRQLEVDDLEMPDLEMLGTRSSRPRQTPAPRASPADGADPWQAADNERACRWCRRLTRSGSEAQAFRLADLHRQESWGGCRSKRGRWRGCRLGSPPLPGVSLKRPQALGKIAMRTGSLVHTLWRFLIMTRCSYSDVTLTHPTNF
jgi:hypothetical protein